MPYFRLPVLLSLTLFALLLAVRGLASALPPPDILSYEQYTRTDQSRVYWLDADRGLTYRWRDNVLHGVGGAEWARGGRHVAYMRPMTSARNDLEIYNRRTGDTITVTNFINRNDQYAWLPNGNCILFISFAAIRERCTDIEDSRLVWEDETGNIRALDITPNGQYVAYTTEDENDYRLWLLDRETESVRQLSTETFYKAALSFSADGQTLTYLQTREGVTRLLQVDLATDNTSVLPLADNVYSTALSPRSNRLAYMRYDRGNWRLHLYDMADRHAITRYEFPRVGRLPSWVR